MTKSKRETELENIILRAKQAYYAFGSSVLMDDALYDEFEDELKALNPQNPALLLVDAPLADPKNTRTKHLHTGIIMGSQAKVKTYEELLTWIRLQNLENELFQASLKVDGASIALYYNSGKLHRALTRGKGGIEGFDVTANLILAQGVPSTLPHPIDCVVRGECLLTNKNWKKINPDAPNPRNLASGVLGRLDGSDCELLSVLAFDIEQNYTDLPTETLKTCFLQEMGFDPVPFSGNLDQKGIKTFFEETHEKRKADKLDFWIDGVVIKIENLEVQKELGSSDKRPKGQRAWKFISAEGTSTLLDYTLSVGRSGAIVPVASIAPVEIGGSTITSVTLHNFEDIQRLGAQIGSKIRVIKANDIIPKIIEVLNPGEGQNIPVPENCPICKSKLSKNENVGGDESAHLYCKNLECPARNSKKISRWLDSLGVLGIGDSVLQSLITNGKLKNISDLYRLKPEEFANLSINEEKEIRIGAKRAESICQEIQDKTTRLTLSLFLGSLSIPNLGHKKAQNIVVASPKFQKLETWLGNSLLNSEINSQAGIPKSAQGIYQGIQETKELILEILPFLEILPEPKTATEKISEGMKGIVCISGSLPSGRKKKEYQEPLLKAGYLLVEDFTKEVSILVDNSPANKPSSKAKKAQKAGTQIMNETQLQNLCQD